MVPELLIGTPEALPLAPHLISVGWERPWWFGRLAALWVGLVFVFPSTGFDLSVFFILGPEAVQGEGGAAATKFTIRELLPAVPLTTRLTRPVS